jgi:hypothetical protein
MNRFNALPFLAFALMCVIVWEWRVIADAERQSAVYAARLDSLAAVAARVDTVYTRDTLTLWRQVRRTDTLTQTVEAWKHDTVRVVEYVRQADSTIRSCTATVLTCEQRVAVRDSALATWQARWDARPKPASAWRVLLEKVGWGLAGYGAGRLAPR